LGKESVIANYYEQKINPITGIFFGKFSQLKNKIGV